MTLQPQHDQNRSTTEDCHGGSSWIPARNMLKEQFLEETTDRIERKVAAAILIFPHNSTHLWSEMLQPTCGLQQSEQMISYFIFPSLFCFKFFLYELQVFWSVIILQTVSVWTVNTLKAKYDTNKQRNKKTNKQTNKQTANCSRSDVVFFSHVSPLCVLPKKVSVK